jgi:organic hydroperoxide reductase OsmC/OhrA
MKNHTYKVQVNWIGNDGEGTKTYRSYRRDHTIQVAGKPVIPGSSDPNFRGDATRYNPEDLLVASLSTCHMLWYLHLCAVNNITVLDYKDAAEGVMVEEADGAGQFVKAVLRPTIKIAAGNDHARAIELHHEAHKFCFVGRSVNFPVEIEAEVVS